MVKITAEQLNIIITAQTSDFTEKIYAVNEALKETVSLSQQAAAAAAAVTGGAVTAEVQQPGSYEPEGAEATENKQEPADFTQKSAAVSVVPQTPAHRAVKRSYTEEEDAGYNGFAFQADVRELKNNQTVIGALSGKDNTQQAAQAAPIEIHTTVELDGDRIGEAVSYYNRKRSRITDGFYNS